MTEVPTTVLFSFGHPARRLVRRLLIAEAMRGAVVGAGVVVVGVVSDGSDHLRFAVLAGFALAGLFVVIGIGQALYWRVHFGDTRYEFFAHELRVVRDGTLIKSWPRDEIYFLGVEGLGASWHGLLTNSAEMPHLVLRTTTGGREEGPPVFFWGRPHMAGVDLQIRDWKK